MYRYSDLRAVLNQKKQQPSTTQRIFRITPWICVASITLLLAYRESDSIEGTLRRRLPGDPGVMLKRIVKSKRLASAMKKNKDAWAYGSFAYKHYLHHVFTAMSETLESYASLTRDEYRQKVTSIFNFYEENGWDENRLQENSLGNWVSTYTIFGEWFDAIGLKIYKKRDPSKKVKGLKDVVEWSDSTSALRKYIYWTRIYDKLDYIDMNEDAHGPTWRSQKLNECCEELDNNAKTAFPDARRFLDTYIITHNPGTRDQKYTFGPNDESTGSDDYIQKSRKAQQANLRRRKK